MKNIGFLVLAILLFGIAFYVYWIVAQENSVVGDVAAQSTRSLRPGAGGSGSNVMTLLKQYQPYLSLASSIGGILSFLFQVRVWMRSRA